jgi:large subunit ribosomal protein L35
MPKMKTSKTAAKRLKVTKNRKVRRRRAGSSHLLSGKSPKKRRSLRKATSIEGRRAKSALRALRK